MRYIHRVRLLVVLLLAGMGLGHVLGQPVQDSPKPSTAPATGVAPTAAITRDYSVEGHYVEACTCKGACAAEISGENPGCDSVAVYQFDKGSYDGADFSGTRVAFTIDHGDSVHIYIDSADVKKREALEKFARAAFAGYGKIDSVAQASIELKGKDGAYTVKINDGNTLTLTTEPVLGGDHKTAVEVKNSQNTLSPTLYQGKCISCAYVDGERKISIEKGRNSFFNQQLKSTGKV